MVVVMFMLMMILMVTVNLMLVGSDGSRRVGKRAAAERVRMGSTSRQEIPEFAERQDEIGHLARAFREMTHALYNKIDAIEQFAEILPKLVSEVRHDEPQR